MVGMELELTYIHDGISMSLYGVETEQLTFARVGKHVQGGLKTFCTHEMWVVVRLSCVGSLPLACNRGIASSHGKGFALDRTTSTVLVQTQVSRDIFGAVAKASSTTAYCVLRTRSRKWTEGLLHCLR